MSTFEQPIKAPGSIRSVPDPKIIKVFFCLFVFIASLSVGDWGVGCWGVGVRWGWGDAVLFFVVVV